MNHIILYYLHCTRIILTCLNTGHEMKLSSHARFFLLLLECVTYLPFAGLTTVHTLVMHYMT
jgi:hypothetical protein